MGLAFSRNFGYGLCVFSFVFLRNFLQREIVTLEDINFEYSKIINLNLGFFNFYHYKMTNIVNGKVSTDVGIILNNIIFIHKKRNDKILNII